MRPTICILLAIVLNTRILRAETPAHWMLKVSVQGQAIEGTPLRWNEQTVHLLGRDGRLWQFPPGEAKDFRKTSNRFQGYSVSELRAALLGELGQSYEATGARHYLIAHARGRRTPWAERFEELYRSLVRYFSIRGFRLQEPPFLLVGVVFADQSEFVRHAAKQGGPASGGITGYYSLDSNRIFLYDATAGAESGAGWEATAATVLHEATHQTSFNVGLHNRYSPPPLWVAEGLASLFEASGVYNSTLYANLSDRINQERFRVFKSLASRHRPELLKSLIASDDFFRASPAAAYAEAWALSFWLIETQPRQYAEYLARTAAHSAFSKCSPAERTADFTAVFGDNWAMLEARFLRYMAEVK